MFEAEALDIVRRLQTAVQKARSNLYEMLGEGEISERVLESTQPWLVGPGCLLKATEPILTRGSITPMDLFNLMTILSQNQVGRMLDIVTLAQGVDVFPEPDFEWLKGWDAPADTSA